MKALKKITLELTEKEMGMLQNAVFFKQDRLELKGETDRAEEYDRLLDLLIAVEAKYHEE